MDRFMTWASGAALPSGPTESQGYVSVHLFMGSI